MRPAARGRPLRLRLRVPQLRPLLGVVIDPFQGLTGRSLGELLQPVLEGPPELQEGATLYRIALQEGVGLSIPLGSFGELGLKAERGRLQLHAPALAAMLLRGMPYQVEPVLLIETPQGRLSRFTLDPPAGATFSLPLGATSLEITRTP